MPDKTYTFTITLQGTGPTIDDAWIDALVEFHSDPGGVPDDEDVELVHEEKEPDDWCSEEGRPAHMRDEDWD